MCYLFNNEVPTAENTFLELSEARRILILAVRTGCKPSKYKETTFSSDGLFGRTSHQDIDQMFFLITVTNNIRQYITCGVSLNS